MSQIDQSKDYFHINRQAAWSPHPLLSAGANFDVGGESNPYFRFYEIFKKTYPVTDGSGQTHQVPGVKFIDGVKSGAFSCNTLPHIAYDLSKHLAGLVGELIWEDIRRKEFPHLPSRQRCIWLIPNLDGVRYWIPRLGVATGTYQVLRVRCQGRFHVASEKYLLGDSVPLTEAVSLARQYWLGVIPENNTEEIIFEGRVTVHEVINHEQFI